MVLKATPEGLQETLTAMRACHGQGPQLEPSLACFTAGQHLLSAVCDEVAGADTVSWELHPRPASDEGTDSVCVDLAVPHLSSEQLQVKCANAWHGMPAPSLHVDSSSCHAGDTRSSVLPVGASLFITWHAYLRQ